MNEQITAGCLGSGTRQAANLALDMNDVATIEGKA